MELASKTQIEEIKPFQAFLRLLLTGTHRPPDAEPDLRLARTTRNPDEVRSVKELALAVGLPAPTLVSWLYGTFPARPSADNRRRLVKLLDERNVTWLAGHLVLPLAGFLPDEVRDAALAGRPLLDRWLPDPEAALVFDAAPLAELRAAVQSPARYAAAWQRTLTRLPELRTLLQALLAAPDSDANTFLSPAMREALMRQLAEPHNAAVETAKSSPRAIALVGMPGIGKTQLALTVARELRLHYQAQLLLAMRDDGGAARPIEDLYHEILAVTQQPVLATARRATLREALRDLFQQHAILLVCDDVATAEQVEALRPGSTTASTTIFMSRDDLIPPGVPVIRMTGLSRPVAVELVHRLNTRDDIAASAIVDYCGGHPQLLRLVVAFVNQHREITLTQLMSAHPVLHDAWGAQTAETVRRTLDDVLQRIVPDLRTTLYAAAMFDGPVTVSMVQTVLPGNPDLAAHFSLLVRGQLLAFDHETEQYHVPALLRAHLRPLLDTADDTHALRDQYLTAIVDEVRALRTCYETEQANRTPVLHRFDELRPEVIRALELCTKSRAGGDMVARRTILAEAVELFSAVGAGYPIAAQLPAYDALLDTTDAAALDIDQRLTRRFRAADLATTIYRPREACAHLRAILDESASLPILRRWGNLWQVANALNRYTVVLDGTRRRFWRDIYIGPRVRRAEARLRSHIDQRLLRDDAHYDALLAARFTAGTTTRDTERDPAASASRAHIRRAQWCIARTRLAEAGTAALAAERQIPAIVLPEVRVTHLRELAGVVHGLGQTDRAIDLLTHAREIVDRLDLVDEALVIRRAIDILREDQKPPRAWRRATIRGGVIALLGCCAAAFMRCLQAAVWTTYDDVHHQPSPEVRRGRWVLRVSLWLIALGLLVQMRLTTLDERALYTVVFVTYVGAAWIGRWMPKLLLGFVAVAAAGTAVLQHATLGGALLVLLGMYLLGVLGMFVGPGVRAFAVFQQERDWFAPAARRKP